MTLHSATPDFIDGLRAGLSDASFREAELRYLEEPRGRWQGQGVVVAPDDVEGVAHVVRACAAAGVPVVPYGGGTGLVGGQIAPDGPVPVILSLERMRAVRGIWPEENVMVVEAGAILQDIHDAAEAVGRLFPLSIAAKGSARLGGLLGTNAGGVNVLRYGNARDLCLGLEAVLPDGRIWHGLKRLRKDNTGYDLRNLLIGSEGTLGVITAAAPPWRGHGAHGRGGAARRARPAGDGARPYGRGGERVRIDAPAGARLSRRDAAGYPAALCRAAGMVRAHRRGAGARARSGGGA